MNDSKINFTLIYCARGVTQEEDKIINIQRRTSRRSYMWILLDCKMSSSECVEGGKVDVREIFKTFYELF